VAAAGPRRYLLFPSPRSWRLCCWRTGSVVPLRGIWSQSGPARIAGGFGSRTNWCRVHAVPILVVLGTNRGAGFSGRPSRAGAITLSWRVRSPARFVASISDRQGDQYKKRATPRRVTRLSQRVVLGSGVSWSIHELGACAGTLVENTAIRITTKAQCRESIVG